MKKLSSLKSLFATMFVTALVAGQSYEVTRYADDNGLPSRIVRDVSQDKNGYLWIAGNNGLYKFDGQQFQGYYSTLKDTIGLRDNKINTLLTAKDGKIWIATPKGLHVFENEIISHISHPKNMPADSYHIIDLFEDSNQNIWVSTYDGFYVVEKKSGKIRDFPELRKNPNYEAVVWGITEDSDGNIWICRSWKPPLVAKKGSYEFKELIFSFKDNLGKKNINPFKYLQFDKKVFLVNSGSGLLKGVLENDSTLLVSKFRNKKGNTLGSEFIYNSIIDSNRNIWTATWKNRFKKYKYEDGHLLEQDVITTNGLENMSGHAISIYEDAQKNIWVSNSNGLYKLTNDKKNITTFPSGKIANCSIDALNIYAITEDKGSNLWVSTATDLYRFNKSDILNGICPKEYLCIKNKDIIKSNRLFIDSQNRLWLSGEGGLFISQLNADYYLGKFIHLTTKDGLPHNWTYDIYEEDRNTYWVANYTRLVKIIFKDKNLKNPQITTYNSYKERNDALVNSFTLELEKDKNGELWVGTFSGLSKLISDKDQGVFKNYKSTFGKTEQLSNNAIKGIFKDKKERLWIGTQTGLNLYDNTSDTFVQFGREHGLPSEYILGIDEDSKGYLWVATTNGLFKTKYSDSKKSFEDITYVTNKDGLADNITNKNAIYIDTDDNVFVGSSKGLSVIDNSETVTIPRAFNLGLSKFEIIQKKKQGFVPIKNRLKSNEIELSHHENSIQLSYSALDFTNTRFNTYRHKFLPVATDWVKTGNRSELTYYNLSPGDYELVLDGANDQGEWSRKPIRLKIKITPPFWKSNLALGLYALLFFGLLRISYLFRIRKRMRELDQQVKLEHALVKEREQLRQENTADFHDELGSKVTKISLFLTLAERSLSDKKDPTEWFKKIRSNIKDLSSGFRDLLWVIDPKKDSLNDTILRLKDYGEDLFNNGQKHFSVRANLMHQSDILLDPQTKKQVVMIFKEAMNNSAKYSKCDQLNLIISSEEDFSCFELTDNGKGFDLERKSKGRGLKNMVNRAKKINAILTITSNSDGTSVHLDRIPHIRDNFNAEAV